MGAAVQPPPAPAKARSRRQAPPTPQSQTEVTSGCRRLMNNGRSYVEVAIARQLRLPAVMARGRAGRWPGAPRGKWRAHGIMRNAEGRINATAIRRIIMFLNLTGPHRRVAGVRAVVAPHWPPPRPTGAGRAPARGSLARISMNPLPALPVVAHALIRVSDIWTVRARGR